MAAAGRTPLFDHEQAVLGALISHPHWAARIALQIRDVNTFTHQPHAVLFGFAVDSLARNGSGEPRLLDAVRLAVDAHLERPNLTIALNACLADPAFGPEELERRVSCLKVAHAGRLASHLLARATLEISDGADPITTSIDVLERIRSLDGRSNLNVLSDAAIDGQSLILTPIEKPTSLLGDGLIVPGTLSMLHGKEGLGKSFLAIDLLICMALGIPWLGIPTTPCRVGLIAFEIPRYYLRERVLKIVGLHEEAMQGIIEPGSSRTKGLDRIVFLGSDDLREPVNLMDPASVEPIIRLIDRHELQMLSFDPLGQAHSGGENDSKDMNPVLHSIKTIAMRTGCAQNVVHHDRKSSAASAGRSAGQEEDDGDAAIGSNVFARSAILQMRLVAKHGMTQLRIHKANLGPKPEPVWLERLPSGRLVPTAVPEQAKDHAERFRQSLFDFLKIQESPVSQADIRTVLGPRDAKGQLANDQTIRKRLRELQGLGMVQPVGNTKDRRWMVDPLFVSMQDENP